MAYPPWHALAALPVAALAWPQAGWSGVLAACVGGVLIDLDHAVDWLASGGRLDYKVRIILPLHGWELPLALYWWRRQHGPTWVAPLIAAWIGHLCLDWLTNNPAGPLGYFVSRRLVVGFDRRRSGWPPLDSDPKQWAQRYYRARAQTLVAALVSTVLLSLLGRRRTG
ncbi:MAG: hypothetical protein CL878_11065 [Dehalococcoidia bacterium]|nr:hypothetical protein [Dehalococcoidia bacterium]